MASPKSHNNRVGIIKNGKMEKLIDRSFIFKENVSKEELLKRDINALSYDVSIDGGASYYRVNGFAVKFDNLDANAVHVKAIPRGGSDVAKKAEIVKYQLKNGKAIIIATLEDPVRIDPPDGPESDDDV